MKKFDQTVELRKQISKQIYDAFVADRIAFWRDVSCQQEPIIPCDEHVWSKQSKSKISEVQQKLQESKKK